MYIAFICNYGYIALIDNKSKQCIYMFKANENIRSCVFNNDDTYIYAISDKCNVYVFDVKQRQCVARHIDYSGIHGTSITISNDNQHYCVGSDSGVVNVYSVDTLQQYIDNKIQQLQPIHTLMNITTPIDNIVYNHDSQLLLSSSQRVKDSLRLYNTIHNYTSYSNWPTVNTPLHYVTCTAFSPHSGYITIGNDRGRVLLYKLKHYNNG